MRYFVFFLVLLVATSTSAQVFSGYGNGNTRCIKVKKGQTIVWSITDSPSEFVASIYVRAYKCPGTNVAQIFGTEFAVKNETITRTNKISNDGRIRFVVTAQGMWSVERRRK